MWEEVSGFCSGVSGSEDFIMIFDGRMREVRRWNDPSLNVSVCVCVCMCVYTGQAWEAA